MCGIVGILAPGRSPKALTGQMNSMRMALKHRGPDGMGSFVADGVALGHTRLAIIDLESTGQQPLTNENGNIHLVANGEIYNYRQLRTELQAKGHRFRSQSDSEVVVHLYEEFGDECLQHLEGMFAFALWDGRRRRLLLARDRFGVKPLYLAQQGDGLSFASELTSLLQGGVVGQKIDTQALYSYMAFSYIPSQMCIVKGVQKVLPAERVVWEGGRLTRQIYWTPQRVQVPMHRIHAAEALAERLELSVQANLVADVPVAAFLSGGVDSSAVVAMASRHKQLKTFCVSFSGWKMNEAPFARAVAKHLGTDHHEVELSLDPIDLLSKIVACMDEPFADSSALPTFAVSQAARQMAKVVLSGDGGDEVFGGYTGRYRVAAMQAMLPRPKMLARSLRALPPWRSGRRSSLPDMLDLAALSDDERFVIERQITSSSDRLSLFGDDMAEKYEETLREIPRASIHHAADWHPVHRALWIDMTTSLPNDMLTKVDRMSMAHGLEVRVPFLSHRLVEFALSLPSRWLVSPWPVEGKRLLRETIAPLLPKGILSRPKQGFCVPLNNWMKKHFFALFDDLCLSPQSRVNNFFCREGLDTLRRAPFAQRARQDLYAILVLELWLRRIENLTLDCRSLS